MWARFRLWWRWEMGRRIELNAVIRLIIVERFFKLLVLGVGGVLLLVLNRHGGLQDFVMRAQDQLNYSSGRGLWHRLVERLAARFTAARPGTIEVLAVAAILYGLLEGFEGVGLLLRRRWAEYLVVIATGAFVPVEVDELLRSPSPLKALTLLINLAVIAYLVRHHRLFMERPSEAEADALAMSRA